MTIIETVIDILSSKGLDPQRVTTPPGFSGLSVLLPDNGQAFFIWSKMDGDDFHFKLARFWQNENRSVTMVCGTLPEAIHHISVLVK